MSRPSLVDGAIRPGGDPNKKIETQRLSNVYHLNGADMAVDDDNTIRIANREAELNNRHSRNFTFEKHESNKETTLYELMLEESPSLTANEMSKRTASCSPDEQQRQMHTENSPRIWSKIRKWFSDHPEHEDRHTAATWIGGFSTVSLHLLCKHSDPPLDIVIDLIESAPEAASFVDDHGWLPLHYACAKGVCEEVLKVLIQNNPRAVSRQDKRQRTPLHFAFFKSQSENNVTTTSTEEEKIRLSKTVEILTTCDSDVAQIADESGRLPLHFAAAYGSSIEALKGLVGAYPESVNVKENLGRTPIHYVMANAHGTMSPSTLQFLLKCPNNTTIHATDIKGNLPLHLLSERATKYNPLDDNPSRQNVETCLNIFLNAKPPPDPVPEFFTALQSMPRWLRDRVVTITYVQDILYKNVSERFPTMIRLMDYYCYIIIIFSFQYASCSHIESSEGTDLLPHTTGSIVACFIGSSYFLVREILNVISMVSLGTSQSWFFDLTSWFDILVIGLVYYYCGAMIRGEQGLDLHDNFREGAVLTLGALWIASINYMRKSSMEVAVFFEAMQCVTRHLSVFLMALIGFLIFFAQMFVVVFRKKPICSDSCNDSEFPHCNFQDSLMKVYTMMVGEIGDIKRYQGNLLAQVIYLAFALLVIILLSNVLIAIVAESHSVIKNERAEILFWSNRLYFVSQINAVSSFGRSLIKQLTCLYGCLQTHVYTEASTNEDQAPSNISNHADHTNSYERAHYAGERRHGLFREGWHELILYVREDFLEDPALCEFLLSLFLRCLVFIFLVPLWLLLGAITAGCLWPPQVREWLHGSYRLSSPSRSVLINQTGSEIRRFAQDITEISNKINLDLGRVRKEVEDVSVNIDEFKKTCKADLSEVKEMMSNLLALYEGDAQMNDP